MMVRPLIFVALLCVGTGCSVRLSDNTPSSFAVTDITPGINNDLGFRTRTLSLEVDREYFVFETSIEATVSINGESFPMNGSGSGTWTYPTNDRDPRQTGRFRHGYEVRYEVHYRYGIFSQRGAESLPSQGVKFIDVLPDVFAESDDPLFFASSATTKEIRITNLSSNPVTLTTIEMRPFGGPGLGDVSGDKFELINPPQVPVLLQSGEGLTLTLRFTGFNLAQGTLAVETTHADHPLLQFSVAGKIIVTPGCICPPTCPCP